ncbi:MAG: PIN domain-containing protein [Candidatus Aenigmarchaeota archaeon]|nr:PIN domain-containing protein [Candidatus Aenigmarchaeota archaeon]
MRVTIDSSFFVSLLLNGEKNHKKAAEIFRELIMKDCEKFTSYLALPEVVGAIRRRTNSANLAYMAEETLKSWIGNMISFKELTSDRIFSAVEATVKFEIRGADAIFVSLNEETDSELLTFDDELKKKIKGKVRLFKVSG